jgi:hypothetical protein
MNVMVEMSLQLLSGCKLSDAPRVNTYISGKQRAREKTSVISLEFEPWHLIHGLEKVI